MTQQEKNMQTWRDIQACCNRGDWEALATYFDPDFRYINASRPDLGTYDEWIKSPMANFTTFPPCRYTIKEMTATDDKVWAYCHHYGVHSGGPYMGIQPTGNEVNVEWISIVTFNGDKVIRIFSIADVLGMFIQLGVIDRSQLPVNPNR
ncbi:hypothetical protein DSC91_007208 [Paraburkholderia caffeinilytica]|uniref:Ester cyclase n=1 Tax=Paraburkholderia caffeinilytica TaxID=1761016 RepID=A0ABQ1LNI8_9BURK|nr:ester cyclase [Paraburkholderia caffeinilytica]AXL53663.1 hypothetical protein DSC91_007208 [Paraburkholderia caffeinilytica]GGC27157.1 hypothetical protein GCM10011400_11970 [Paraburkholderia caffeinilytica]CAB3780100.1 hypothetical protein LMG28690_00880 [Paraburkholderia caffeinilytica]